MVVGSDIGAGDGSGGNHGGAGGADSDGSGGAGVSVGPGGNGVVGGMGRDSFRAGMDGNGGGVGGGGIRMGVSQIGRRTAVVGGISFGGREFWGDEVGDWQLVDFGRCGRYIDLDWSVVADIFLAREVGQ